MLPSPRSSCKPGARCRLQPHVELEISRDSREILRKRPTIIGHARHRRAARLPHPCIRGRSTTACGCSCMRCTPRRSCRCGAGMASARATKCPGRTGVSHWVEHMNFKGTTNIPRDEMKGIVERFGGMWNGYTWIDQTTYLETAGTRRARSDAVHRSRADDATASTSPPTCESERTVIISELQGGENDPEQLLDTEVTATAFRCTSVPASDDRLARRPPVDEPRRSLSALPAVLHPEQRHPRRRRRRRRWTTCCAGCEQRFGAIPAARRRARRRASSRRRSASAGSSSSAPGTTAYLKVAWHAPAATHADFFPMLVLDAALTGAKGVNLWASFRGAAAAAQGAPLHRARRAAVWRRR